MGIDVVIFFFLNFSGLFMFLMIDVFMQDGCDIVWFYDFYIGWSYCVIIFSWVAFFKLRLSVLDFVVVQKLNVFLMFIYGKGQMLFFLLFFYYVFLL